jgi:hypothetical protein
MKIITFLILPLFALVFFSCKKDNGTTTPLTSVKVKTYTEDNTFGGTHTVVTFNINYDSSDKIISMISASDTGYKFVYQYNSTTSFTMDIFYSNVLVNHDIFFINSSSFVDSSVQYYNTIDTSTEKYLYNASNQLVRQKEYDYTTATGSVLWNTHNFTYDSNGNVISDADDHSVITFEYTAVVGSLSIDPLYVLYYTKSHNLVQTSTYTSDDGTTEIGNYTYTFDSQNRLSTEKAVTVGTGDVLIITYTYY